MEPESVLIIATVFIFINTGIILVCELFRDKTAEDNVIQDTISRIVCPSNLVVSVLAMIGAQKVIQTGFSSVFIAVKAFMMLLYGLKKSKRKSLLLLPFLGTLTLFMVFMALAVIYIATWCPYKLTQGESNFVCSMAIIMGATCIGGLLFGTCQTYIVLSLFKFLRYGTDDSDDNPADIKLTDKLNYDDPSTSY